VKPKTVVLSAVPVDRFVALQRHIDEIFRELQVISAGGEAEKPVEPELAEVMGRLLTEYAEARTSSWAQAEQAINQGRERADVVVDLVPEAADWLREFNGLLDRINQLSRDGRLLALPEPAEQTNLRRWVVDETVRQLTEGSEPRPCPL
jgi:hypothetical protein